MRSQDGAEVSGQTPRLTERITSYLTGGGLFNPELAIHDAVRDLLIDCRTELSEAVAALKEAQEFVEAKHLHPAVLSTDSFVLSGCERCALAKRIDEIVARMG